MRVAEHLDALECKRILLDPERLDALRDFELTSHASKRALDRLTRLAAEVLQVPLTIISFVDSTEHRFKSFHGLPEPWASNPVIPIENSVCQYTLVGNILSVEDVRVYPLLADNPAVPALNLVAYLGIPLISNDGHNLGAFCAIDFHQRRWSPREVDLLKELAASAMSEIYLHATLSKLQSAQEEREKVIAMMAHDIRSPIAAAHGYAELWGLSLDDQEFCEEAASAVQRLSKQALKILEGYLDEQLRSSSTKKTITKISVDLVPLIRNIVADLLQVHGKIIQFHSDLREQEFAINQHSFTRALENLAGNAVKYGSQGGFVTITLSSSDEAVTVTVHNWGNPISTEDQRHIFGRGERILSPVNRDKRGWGLGLELVHSVMTAHGGRIEVASDLASGTNFKMIFPH